MVHVYGDGHGGVCGGFCGRVHEEARGVVHCPGEEEDHGRGAFGFCGADGGDYAFEVVAAYRWDAVVVCVGVVEDGAGVGHDGSNGIDVDVGVTYSVVLLW